MKKRLDILLTEKGLCASREKAKAVIMSGIVYVDGVKEDKAGTTFEETAVIEVRGQTLRYVSRSDPSHECSESPHGYPDRCNPYGMPDDSPQASCLWPGSTDTSSHWLRCS